MSPGTRPRLVAGALVVLALLLAPAPLLPPHRLAERLHSLLRLNWKAAYLAAALGLQVGFYGSLGALAARAINRASTLRGRLIQIVVLPLALVVVAVVIRSIKLGFLPMLANALVPMAACTTGAGLALGLRYCRWRIVLLVTAALITATLWGFFGGASGELSRATEACLRRLLAAGPALPSGDARFGALVQTAFAPRGIGDPASARDYNRAALLALGVAVGHERLARFAGLDPKSELVRAASSLRIGATLRGRDDWSRHFTLSAALAVVGNPLVSDAGGLLKEQLDALTHGSGFSFGDLAADRAGVRFADAATRSEPDAIAMRNRLQHGFVVDDFFPSASDLPENLTVDQFRKEYGGVGTQRYREQVREIEARLDKCPGLSGFD